MQQREKVIKTFENKEAKKVFYRNLRKDLLVYSWISPLIILGMALMYIAITYFLGDTKLSFGELFQEVSFGVYVSTGLAILWGVGDILAKNRVTLSVNFTENHLFLEHYRLFYKSKFFIPYQFIQYIKFTSDQASTYANVMYLAKNGESETFATLIVPLDFWQSFAKQQQLVLVSANPDVATSSDDSKKWYTQTINPDEGETPIDWRQFQRFLQQTPVLTLVNKAQLMNYSNLSDEEISNYLSARYRFELSPTTYGYLEFDEGFIYAFVPSTKDFKFVKDMAISLQNSLSNN
ncbi:MAG TPA: hypothetical protein DCS93_01835 [Microscillaceae bacterium]|nr:hypothetical protein [Microscillaceae bacterium]